MSSSRLGGMHSAYPDALALERKTGVDKGERIGRRNQRAEGGH
jgi:hypothetical protein